MIEGILVLVITFILMGFIMYKSPLARDFIISYMVILLIIGGLITGIVLILSH